MAIHTGGLTQWIAIHTGGTYTMDGHTHMDGGGGGGTYTMALFQMNPTLSVCTVAREVKHSVPNGSEPYLGLLTLYMAKW